MSAPNLFALAVITAKTALIDLSSTSATSVVSNASASGKVFKITSLTVANDDGANAADITIGIYSAAALGGTAVELAKTITVPAKGAIVIIGKDNPIYLEEDKSIGATASAANDLNVICSYEEISQ